MLYSWNICFIVFNIQTYDELWWTLSKINATAYTLTWINFPISCQQTTKTTLECNTETFGPVCHCWSVTFKYMHDSKPQRCVQQHKS